MRFRSGIKLLLVLSIVIGLAWLFASQWEAARRVVYVIPAGTAAGQADVSFPNELTLTLGIKDTLVIENRDDAVHTFGPFVIAPHSTLTKHFKHALVYEGACTVHPSQQMKLVVNPAPWHISGE